MQGIVIGVSVSLSARVSQKPHFQTPTDLLCIWPVAVARSSSDDNAMSDGFAIDLPSRVLKRRQDKYIL